MTRGRGQKTNVYICKCHRNLHNLTYLHVNVALPFPSASMCVVASKILVMFCLDIYLRAGQVSCVIIKRFPIFHQPTKCASNIFFHPFCFYFFFLHTLLDSHHLPLCHLMKIMG